MFLMDHLVQPVGDGPVSVVGGVLVPEGCLGAGVAETGHE
jgi:hypothetical protein